MQVSYTVCNVEPVPGEETKHYTIATDGEKVDLDLCDRHRSAIDNLMSFAQRDQATPRPAKKASPRKAATKKATAPRRRNRVMTVEQIEAMKS